MKNNLFTKECFYNALINLMQTKPFESIQISEICEVAGYNRSTFYRTFDSKIDILFDKFNRELDKYKKMLQEFTEMTFIDKMTEFFELLRGSRELFLTMHESNMDVKMFEMFYNLYPFTYSGDNFEYHKTFRTAGVFGVLISWISSGMKENSHEMAVILQDVMNNCTAEY